MKRIADWAAHAVGVMLVLAIFAVAALWLTSVVWSAFKTFWR